MASVAVGSSAPTAAEGSEADSRRSLRGGDPGRRPRPRPLHLLLLVPTTVVSLCFYPGHMSADTLAQIAQARDGGFTNQHAPLLSALWYLGWPLGVRPGWVLVIQVLVFVGGTYLVLRSFFDRWPAALLTAAISLSPPVFGMLGYLSRDTWFTALLMATFGFLAWSMREQGRRSSILLILALAASYLALASRQNAVAAMVVANAALAGHALSGRLPGGRIRRAVVVPAAGVVLTGCVFASQLGVAALIGVRDVHPEQYVFIYDLEVLSHDLHRNLFPPDVMARRGVAVIEQYYNIDSVNPLLFGTDPPVLTPLADGPLRSLSRAWKKHVLGHPVDYLEGRWELWLRQVSLTREADFIYHPVVDPNPWGLRVRFAGLNGAARDYVETFADRKTLDGGPLHTVWVYLAIAVLGAVVLRRRARPDQRVAGLLALSVVLHQVGLMFGAMGTQYRFQFPVVVVGAVVLLALARVVVLTRRGRTHAP